MVRASDGGGSGQGSTFAMTDEAVRRVQRRYDVVAEVCTGIAEEVPQALTLVTEGCGPFALQIDPGATPFTVSWEATLMLTADEASLISRNVHEVSASVTDLDRSLTGGMLWATTS